MPSNFFSAAQAASLSSLNIGDKIHVTGICGVAMAQIAIALHQLGYVVSGSDKEFYEPMGSLLRSYPISLHQGFDESHIPNDVRLVVIGNSISYGNNEVNAVESKGVAYTFFPKLLAEVVIRNNHSIVISGTHGKTTTSALGATVLHHAQRDPSYFIGGVAKGLPDSLHIGHGALSIVEGDEYDSAFFAKVPKFNFYKPTTLVITSIEYDHADIYPNLESIIKVFDDLVRTVPSTGTVICCADCPQTRALAKIWKHEIPATVISYGESDEADVKVESRVWEGDQQRVTLREGERMVELYTPMMGVHNARNATAIYLASRSAGLTHSEIIQGLKQFEGVRRRQDIRASKNGIVLIEDFAHHPTAVLETLRAIRERYFDKRIIAVFEPRSNTSRRKVFQDAYTHAFASADKVLLCEVSARHNDAGLDLLDVQELAVKIGETGKDSQSLPSSDQIGIELKKIIKSDDVVVVMSNGSFGGLIDTLSEHILRI